MTIRSTSWHMLPALVALVSVRADAQPFPLPRPLPCAGAEVVSAAVLDLATKVAAAERVIDDTRSGAWRSVRDVAEAACRAGDRAALDAVAGRCIDQCRDEDDRYRVHIDYADTLQRFGDPAAAEAQYRAAVTLRGGVPANAVEAFNRWVLLLQQQGRSREAFDLLSRLGPDELPNNRFAAMLKLWVMNQLGMDVSGEQTLAAAIAGGGLGPSLFPPAPPTPGEIAVEPLVVETRENVTLEPRGVQNAENDVVEREPGRLYFRSMSTRNPGLSPPRLTLEKGSRFVMVAVLGGDACRIEHGGNTYDLVFCPWLVPGDAGQPDVYRTRPRARDSTVAELREPGVITLTPIPPQQAPSGPPSDAELWRRFHYDLDFFGKPPSTHTQDVLERQLGLSAEEAGIVVAEGRAFLAELAAIDSAAREEIAARFGAPVTLTPPPLRGTGERPPVLVPGRTPDGRLVRDALAEEGFIARIEARKDAALAAHRATLARFVRGPALERLEAAVRAAAQ